MGATGPKVSSITTSIAKWRVGKRDSRELGGQTVVDVHKYLRSDVGGSSIEVFLRYISWDYLHRYDYLLAAGKWSSGIRAFAPAATAAGVSTRSIIRPED